MSKYYDDLREWQHTEEKRQNENDKVIHKSFTGELKPTDEQIIQKLKMPQGTAIPYRAKAKLIN